MQTLHLISHTHWDREWYLTFQQFRIKLVHLVDHLLDILDQDALYRHFMLDGQTIVLEDYLQIRPERAEDLRRYIQNGRILIGPWYILPDEFLVSPEATIRNLLVGDQMAGRFGPKMKVGYIPDPFGHIGQMPQILRGFDIDNACLWRGVADQPNEFWWQSADGSRVLMGYLPQGYGNAAGILNGTLDSFVSEARGLRDLLTVSAAAPHHLLMHGVDHMEPQAETSSAVAYAAGKLDGDCLIHSTLPDYFAAVRASIPVERLPVVTGELRAAKAAPLLPGVLSTRMWIKQRNQACETLLEKWAEPFSTWAANGQGSAAGDTGLRSPEALLGYAWRLLMQCHPHDSICGCSIDAVHDEMRPRFDQVEQIGEELTRQSLMRLSARVDTQPGFLSPGFQPSSAVVIFNPTSAERSDPVSVVVESLVEDADFELVDESGAPVPFQLVERGSGELLSMQLNRKELQSNINFVADGNLMDSKIQAVTLRRQGAEVFVAIATSQMGQPNRPAWERARQEIDQLLQDLSVTIYHIRVRSVSSSQVLLSAPAVAGLGYRTVWVRAKTAETRPALKLSPAARALAPLAARLASSPAGKQFIARLASSPAAKPPYKIENEYFTVECLPDGTLTVLDKRSQTLYSGQNRFVDTGDRGDEYNYGPLDENQPCPVRLKGVRIERGPICQVLDLALEMTVPAEIAPDRSARSSKKVSMPISSRVTLNAGVPRVDIHSEVDNRARDHRLRVHFAAPFAAAQADYDGHFEVVRRPLGVPAFDADWVEQSRPEVPQRAFTGLRGERLGLVVANRGLPEATALRRADGNAEIAITLLRCVGWLSREDFPERKGHAGPFMATPGAQMPGKWGFDYSIIPYAGADLLPAYQQAYAFEAPLRAVNATIHGGALPALVSYLEVEPAAFVISAVKTAEDGQGWLARGYNLTDSEIQVSLKPLLPYASAARANLAEETQSGLERDAQGRIRFAARPHEIVTIRFR